MFECEKLLDDLINKELQNDPGHSQRAGKNHNPDSYPSGIAEQDKGSLPKMHWTLLSDTLPPMSRLWRGFLITLDLDKAFRAFTLFEIDMTVNIEIKARSNQLDIIREVLKSRNADFKGVDPQIDTYLRVPKGRLKLREGNIENHLIYYEREDKRGPKKSRVTLFEFDPKSNLKEILVKALEVLIVVEKQREIYYIDNIKFHLDAVKDLGTFVEIEAASDKAEERLYAQVREYMKLFGIKEEDLIACSYSDLLLNQRR